MVTHTPNCHGGTCDDPETTFLCDVCGDECAACCGVAESETCDDCEGKKMSEITYEWKEEWGVFNRHTLYDGKRLSRGNPDLSIETSATQNEFRIEFPGSTELGESCHIESEMMVRFLDHHNLNTTANELRAKLDTVSIEQNRLMLWLMAAGYSELHIRRIADGGAGERDDMLPREILVRRELSAAKRQLEEARAQAETDLAAINDRDLEIEQLKSDLEVNLNILEESSRQRSEVSAVAKATMGEREALKLKLAEREGDLVRAGKLLDETQRQLDEAHQTIAQLRQADTVRPKSIFEEVMGRPVSDTDELNYVALTDEHIDALLTPTDDEDR